MRLRLRWAILATGLIVILLAAPTLQQAVVTGAQPTPAFAPKPTSTPLVYPTVIAPRPTPTTEWRTFEHPHDKYRVSFPPDWYLTTFGIPNETFSIRNFEVKAGEKVQFRPDFDNLFTISIASSPKPTGQTIEDYLDNSQKGGRDPANEVMIISEEAITFNGRRALKREQSALVLTTMGTKTYVTISIWVERNPERLFSIGGGPADSSHVDTFWKIVNSVEFLDGN